jgi:hypothetical protein
MRTLGLVSMVSGLLLMGGGQEGEIVGRVTDLFGAGLAGADVVLHRGEATVQAESDSNGEFSFGDLEHGEYSLSVEVPGFTRERLQLRLARGERRELTVGLQLGTLTDVIVPVAGTVVDESGRPVSGARVVAVPALNLRLARSTRADESGEFELTLHTAGQFLLFAEKEGFAVESATLVAHGQRTEATRVDFKLRQLLRSN